MIARLKHTMQAQAAEMHGPRTAVTSTIPDRCCIQNTSTTTVHLTRITDNSKAVCGWTYRGEAHRTKPRASRSGRDVRRKYRILDDITDILGQMLCEHCLPPERATAFGMGIAIDDLSGDEEGSDTADSEQSVTFIASSVRWMIFPMSRLTRDFKMV